ncbi:CDP-glucose 4,6-dehydratase [Marinoscillum furvescens]|nr:CDP-glucose 4,6-dehydratase [Marinoscillum furvescens]
MSDLNNFYRDKRVLITGHTGFKGSWLVSYLLELNATVAGYSLAPKKEQNLFDLLELENKCQHSIGDIRNLPNLKKVINDFQPDIIFHLAAQALVKSSYEDPIDTYSTNVLGTANLLEATKGIKGSCAVVVITTDKVYHNEEWAYPYRENDRLGGYDPYSSSKACCELLTASFRNSFFPVPDFKQHQTAIATARSGNVIGGGDWSEFRIIPDIVRALVEGKTITLRNPASVRPWQHVLDPLYGYLLLGAKLSESPEHFSEAWNFAPMSTEHITVEQLTKQAIQIWGEGEFEQYRAPKDHLQHETSLLTLDASKSSKLLAWKPVYDGWAAIEHTIQWYKDFHAMADVTKLVNSDIKSHLKNLK